MATQHFSNNASALLAAGISDTDLTIQVANGFGVLYPNPGVGEFFEVTLEDQAGNVEIVKIESRASDLLTVASGGRGQGGTSAQSWTGGVTRVECRLTAAALDGFLQKSGGTMSGDLDMDENEIKDADLTGSATKIRGGQIINVPIRGVADDDSNEILVPVDGSRATAGGDAILTEGDNLFESNKVFAAGMIMLWFGSAGACPAGWAICDGTNGTPDMRGRTAIGVDGTYALNAAVGAASVTPTITATGSGHNHNGSVGGHALTEEEGPAHRHFIASGVNYTGGMGDKQLGNTEVLARYSNDIGGDTQYILRGRTVGLGGDAQYGLTSQSGGSSTPHSHDFSQGSDGAHTHTTDPISVMQPSRALHYIMKT